MWDQKVLNCVKLAIHYIYIKLQSILSLCNSSEGKFKKVSFSV